MVSRSHVELGFAGNSSHFECRVGGFGGEPIGVYTCFVSRKKNTYVCDFKLSRWEISLRRDTTRKVGHIVVGPFGFWWWGKP